MKESSTRMHTDSPRFEIIKARTGKNALALCLSDGTQRFVHSAYDPENEAGKWVTSCKLTGDEACIILGYGLGYHVKALSRAHPDIKPLVFDVAGSAVLFDADVCDGDNVNLFRAASDDELKAGIENFLAAFNNTALRILFYMPAVKTDQTAYNSLLSVIYSCIYKKATGYAKDNIYIERAAALFSAAASIAPNDWRCLYYLGLMQAGLGDYKSALISIGFAVRICADIEQKAVMAFTLGLFNECLRADDKKFLSDLYADFIRDFAGTKQADMAKTRLDIVRKASEPAGKRAVFCMSTGRCGTLFLCELAQSNLKGWDIGHEKQPTLASPPNKVEVVNGILEKKQFFDGSRNGLFETNHQFLKHYCDEARCVFGANLRVFHLIRDPVEVAYSFAMRCSAPGRCAPWKGRDGSRYLSLFHLNPERPHERRFMRHWTPEWTMFESNLWEGFEVHARAFDFSDSLKPEQTFVLPFIELNDEERMKQFFSWVRGDGDLAVHGADSADRHTNVVPTKVDDEVLGVYTKWLVSLPESDLAVVRRVLGRMQSLGVIADNAPSIKGLEMLETASV